MFGKSDFDWSDGATKYSCYLRDYKDVEKEKLNSGITKVFDKFINKIALNVNQEIKDQNLFFQHCQNRIILILKDKLHVVRDRNDDRDSLKAVLLITKLAELEKINEISPLLKFLNNFAVESNVVYMPQASRNIRGDYIKVGSDTLKKVRPIKIEMEKYIQSLPINSDQVSMTR